MFKRILAIAALALALTACIPAGGIPGAEFLGTFGQPTGAHSPMADAVITRVEADGASQAGVCSAAPAGACGGCTATCAAGHPARCASGVTRYPTPGSSAGATCAREAVCACG